jgi:3-hydroxyisobutyrate dehydrogenase-like beta-hydroxyacid dehydrogenase
MDTNESIGFIGLGALGAPIAANLLASGRKLKVWNRTASKAEPLVSNGAEAVRQPADAITRGSVVFTILWDDASLEQVVNGPGFLDALGPNGIHVSMTTITPDAARRVARLHEAHGSAYVEAPIFGIPAAALTRQLIVCLAGPAVAKERVRPLLEAMGGQRIFDFGEAIGAATATKLVGNFMIISAFVAMQESFHVLARSGVDPQPTLEMLTSTLLATPGNQRYAGYLLSGKPMPTSGIPLKDAGLFERFAQSVGAPVVLANAVRSVLARAQN